MTLSLVFRQERAALGPASADLLKPSDVAPTALGRRCLKGCYICGNYAARKLKHSPISTPKPLKLFSSPAVFVICRQLFNHSPEPRHEGKHGIKLCAIALPCYEHRIHL
jgi:hypothetical protein